MDGSILRSARLYDNMVEVTSRTRGEPGRIILLGEIKRVATGWRFLGAGDFEVPETVVHELIDSAKSFLNDQLEPTGNRQ